jgi:hypothetical protein
MYVFTSAEWQERMFVTAITGKLLPQFISVMQQIISDMPPRRDKETVVRKMAAHKKENRSNISAVERRNKNLRMPRRVVVVEIKAVETKAAADIKAVGGNDCRLSGISCRLFTIHPATDNRQLFP